MGDQLRQGAPGGGGRDREVRDGYDCLEISGFEAHGAHAFGGEGADDEATEEGGRGVVRVPVELADEVQEVGRGDLTPEEVVGRDGAAYQGGGAATQTPGGRNGVLLDEVEVRSEERRVGKECRSRWSPHH